MPDLGDHLRSMILAAAFFPAIGSIPALAQGHLPPWHWLLFMVILGPTLHIALASVYHLTDDNRGNP